VLGDWRINLTWIFRMNNIVEIWSFALLEVVWRHRCTDEVDKFIIYWCVIPWGYRWLKSYKLDGFWRHNDITTKLEMKSAFVQLQNLLFEFKFPSFWHTSSKYGMKHQICGQLCVEQKSKIWCKNIHAFLRNCDFRVGAFYFDAPCTH